MTRKRDGMSGYSIWRVNAYRAFEVQTAYGPGNVVDGSTSTRWSSWVPGTGDEWVEVDMGGPQALKSVTINWEAAYAVSFEIQGEKA